MVYEAQELLDKQDGVTPVHNRFYELSSNYHKLMGNHAEYYRDALRFLGCTELSTIPSKTRAGFPSITLVLKYDSLYTGSRLQRVMNDTISPNLILVPNPLNKQSCSIIDVLKVKAYAYISSASPFL